MQRSTLAVLCGLSLLSSGICSPLNKDLALVEESGFRTGPRLGSHQRALLQGFYKDVADPYGAEPSKSSVPDRSAPYAEPARSSVSSSRSDPYGQPVEPAEATSSGAYRAPPSSTSGGSDAYGPPARSSNSDSSGPYGEPARTSESASAGPYGEPVPESQSSSNTYYREPAPAPAGPSGAPARNREDDASGPYGEPARSGPYGEGRASAEASAYRAPSRKEEAGSAQGRAPAKEHMKMWDEEDEEAEQGFEQENSFLADYSVGKGDACAHLDDFPADLWTTSKQLDRFGGAQEHDDGSIDVYELRFRLPADKKSADGKVVLRTKFKAVEDSVLKVEAKGNQEGVAVSVQLEAAGRSAGQPALRQSRGVDEGSLLVPFLPRSSAGEFDQLVLTFDTASARSDAGGKGKPKCLSFQFFLRIEPLETVLAEFRCPARLPSAQLPESKVQIKANSEEEVHIGRDDFLITPPAMAAHARGASFAYPMHISVTGGPAALVAVASFDWILSDLHLVLADDKEAIIAKSHRASALDEDGPFETSTILDRTLEVGKYTLYIFDAMIMQLRAADGGTEEEREEEEEEEGEGVCLGFSLQLDMAAAGKSPAKPRISLIAVDPGVALHLPPTKPFNLVLRFSKPLAKIQGERAVAGDARVRGEVECTGAEPSEVGEVGGDGLLCEDALFLFPEEVEDKEMSAEEEARMDVRPRRFRVRAGGKEVEVTFGPEPMAKDKVYLLHVEEGFFRGEDGRIARVNQHVGSHEYAVSDSACKCGGRGKCMDGACVCEAAYTGVHCDECASGFHYEEEGSRAECVKDKKPKAETQAQSGGLVIACDRYSCNGHGNCLPTTSSELDCMCDFGYETSGGQFCSSCAPGYSGYPNCQPETEEEVREEEGCRLPLLPETLDQEGLLGEDGRLHLQGDYFLDPELDSHVIPFTLRGESLVRVEVDAGRHVGHVKVAAALEKRLLGAGNDWEAVDRSKARWVRVDEGGSKGSIAVLAEGSDGPAKRVGQEAQYRLVLAYEVVGGIDMSGEGECTSVGLEVAVTPIGEVEELRTEVGRRCPRSREDKLPLPEHVEVPAEGWHVGGCYFLSPSAGAEEGGRDMLRGTALQYVTIEVPAVAGKMARLRAELGFRFEMSHWRLLLERDPEDGESPACQLPAAASSGGRTGQAAGGRGEATEGGGRVASDEGHYGREAAEEAKEDRVSEGEGKYLPSGKEYESSPTAPYAHIYGGGKQVQPPAPRPELPTPYGHIYGDPAGPYGGEGGRKDEDGGGAYEPVRPNRPYGEPSEGGGAYREPEVERQGAYGGGGHGRYNPQGGRGGDEDEEDEEDERDRDADPDSEEDEEDADPEADEEDADGVDLQDVIKKALAELVKEKQGDDDDDDEDADGRQPPRFEVHWPAGFGGGRPAEADPYGGGRARDPYGGRGGGGRDPYGAPRDPGGAYGERGPDFGAEEHWQGGREGRHLLEAGEAGGRRGAGKGGGLGRGEGLRCLSGRDQWNRNTLDEPLAPGRYILWVARDPAVEGKLAKQRTKLPCLPLDLTVDVSFEPAAASPATCPGRTLPSTLHEAGYLLGDITDVHIQGEFNMRDARLKGRHAMEVSVRQAQALFRAHVMSLHPVDIRLDIYRKDGGKWEIVRAARPHMEGGLRGDSMVAVLAAGQYKLQMAFLNPGGGAGRPEWDFGEGVGREQECEVVELEMALAGVETLSEDAGWDRVCPEAGTDKVPEKAEVGVLAEGKSFNVPPHAKTVAESLFMGKSGTPYRGADGQEQFFVRTKEAAKGHVIGTYKVHTFGPALLRAGLSSDFLHDDIELQLFDASDRLVLAGSHRRSYSHLHSVIPPGEYSLVIRQPLSAFHLLGGRGESRDWEQRTDPNSKQVYWYNSKRQVTQWERPPEMTGSRCARFAFWAAVDVVESGTEECRLQKGLVQTLPPSLDVPGMLALHRTAYVQGHFPVLKSASGAALDTVRLTVKEPSLLRVVVASGAAEGVMSSLKLYTTEGDGMEEKLVDVGTPLGPEFKDVQWSRTQYGNRLIMTVVVGEELEAGSSQRFVVAVHHWAGEGEGTGRDAAGGCEAFMLQLSVQPTAMLLSREERDRECPGEDVWPRMPSLASLYSCAEAPTDGNFRCLNELTTTHILQEESPKQRQYALRIEELSNLRIELGFRLYGPSMVAVIEHQPCPQGAAQGPCEDGGADGRGPWGGRALVSQDLAGAAVLSAHWVPPGRYMMTMAEQARGVTRGEGPQCVPFSVRVVVEAAEVPRETDGRGGPAHALPADLHGTPYLAFLDAVHLFGRYGMARGGAQQQVMALDIGKAHSLFRLDAKATQGALTVTLERTKLPSGERLRAAELVRSLGVGGGPRDPQLRESNTHLLADLDQGSYQLTFRYTPSDWSQNPHSQGRQRGSFFMQLAIAANVGPEVTKDCTATLGPSFDGGDLLYGEKAAHFHWQHLRLDNRKQLLSTRRLLRTLPLHGSHRSRLRVQVRSAFLPSSLILSLLFPAPSDSDSTHWGSQTSVASRAASAPPPPSCTAGFNSCELEAVLQGGKAEIALFQPTALPEFLAHCLRYSLLVTVHPLDHKHHAGCLDQPLLPVSLGAITQTANDKETSVLYWDWAELTVPAAEEEETTEEVEVGWVDDGGSVLHVVWEERVEGLAVELAPAAGRKVKESWQQVSSYEKSLHEASFGLQTPSGGRAMAALQVKTQLRGQRHHCPLWGLQIFLRPLAALTRAAACPPNAGKQPPPTTLAMNGKGFGVLEATASMPADTWPPLDDPRCQSTRCDRSHDIAFTPPYQSHFQFSLEFDPLVVSYSVLLIQVRGQSSSVVASARPSFPPQASPPRTLKRLSLAHQIPSGQYILRVLRGPALGGGRGEGGARGLCSPLRLRMAVAPMQDKDAGQPVVVEMSPPGARSWPKGRALSVRLVLSEGVDPQTRLDAFSLRPLAGIEKEDWGLTAGRGGGEDAEAQWLHASWKEVGGERTAPLVVGFSAEETAKARRGVQYVLWFRDAHYEVQDAEATHALGAPGSVQGAMSRETFMQPPPWVFSFADKPCSGRGRPGAYGLCECEGGRAGWECESCDPARKGGCDAAAQEEEEEREGVAEDGVMEGAREVGAGELAREQREQEDDKAAAEKVAQGAGERGAAGGQDAGYGGNFHYREPEGRGGGDGGPYGAPASEGGRGGGAGDPYGRPAGGGGGDDAYAPPRNTGPYGDAGGGGGGGGGGAYASEGGPYGGGGGAYGAGKGGSEEGWTSSPVQTAVGGEGSPVLNQDGAVDAESMAAWEREQREKRAEEARIAREAAGGGAAAARLEESAEGGKLPSIVGVLCSFFTCHDAGGWSMGWLVGGVGLVGVVLGATVLRRRFRRNHDSYRMLRHDDDDL